LGKFNAALFLTPIEKCVPHPPLCTSHRHRFHALSAIECQGQEARTFSVLLKKIVSMELVLSQQAQYKIHANLNTKYAG